jgi:hypothetical protein
MGVLSEGLFDYLLEFLPQTILDLLNKRFRRSFPGSEKPFDQFGLDVIGIIPRKFPGDCSVQSQNQKV